MPRKNERFRNLRYASAYPCCGQSRFEPVRRTALDGKVWWCAYDNRRSVFVQGLRRTTRRALVLDLLMAFQHDRLTFEADNNAFGIAWLKGLTSIDQALRDVRANN